MASIIAIAAGGAIGAIARYGTDRAVSTFLGQNYFGVLTSNVIGSFFLGLFVAGLMNKASIPQNFTFFFTVGVCGSYTTFSTLMLSSISLLEKGDHLHFGINLIGSILIGLCAAFTGLWIGRNII